MQGEAGESQGASSERESSWLLMFLWMVMAESPRKMEQFDECMQSFIHSRDSFLALARKMSAKERLDSSHISATENEVSEKNPRMYHRDSGRFPIQYDVCGCIYRAVSPTPSSDKQQL